MPRSRCAECKKWSWPDLEAAYAAALSSSARYGHPFRAYRCPNSGAAWHLTSKPARVPTTEGETQP